MCNYEGFTIIGSVTIDDDARRAPHRHARGSGGTRCSRRASASAALTLADEGKARYTLVIPRDAQRIEQKAAGDLRPHLQLICGADFPVVTEDQFAAGSGPFISIGRTQLLAKSTCQWKSADLAAEGYALEVIGGNVYLYGGSGRGLMHGVYCAAGGRPGLPVVLD